MKMRQSILMSGLVVCCLNAHAIDATKGMIENCDWTPLQLSIAPPAQLFSSSTKVLGLRFNLLMGYNCKVTGLDVGTLFNLTDDLKGIQFSFCNQAAGFIGVQLGCFNTGGFVGPPYMSQPPTRHIDVPTHSRGIQVGVVNHIGRREPFFDPTETAVCLFSGLQLGLFNSGDGISGVQIGVRNEADDIKGIQIGIRNYAHNLHGVQIGLLNTAENGAWVCPHGLLGPEIDKIGLPIVNAVF